MSIIKNKKAYFDYEIQKSFEAGIELLGFEVKALKAGKASLDGSFITIRGGQAFLLKATISPFQVGNTPPDYEPTRERRLLLKKSEIKELSDIVLSKGTGQTIVPLGVYMKANRLKMEIGLVRGKKKFDKRQSIKKRDTERDIRRELL